MNASSPDLQAFVGERQIGNEYYPLIVGGLSAYLPYEKAKNLKNYAITKLGLSSDGAYFSDYNPGLPRPKVK
ncbi:hypothetical protein P6U16_00055 [Rhizobium sp. 32-5/1]|uniref:hypothetical protein n=1 Tax=Rhizobium sp. 32-5/1 TaxID=3019602 RepID=UPI00240D7BBE|nr:hypothetical protein [Rhizobium sp. 32-5/1]WEZ83340.1 hypothetical protein P6U16_00055 [Rhizobium sp. 32-5/1]